MSTTYYEVPLSPTPQIFITAIVGVIYQLSFRWVEGSQGGWVMDMAKADGTPLLGSLPLTTGCNLLEQHEHLGIGAALFISTAGNKTALPTFENLGKLSHLWMG